jgi:hypothetical protein
MQGLLNFGDMRRLLGVAVAANALTAAIEAQGTVPGWYMETRNVTSSTATGVSKELVSRTWASGGRFRQTDIAAVSDMFPEGTFALGLDSTKAMYFVSPSIRTIRMMTVPGAAQAFGLDGRDESQQFRRVGPGEDILGHHTVIYELTDLVRVAMPMSGDSGARALRRSLRVWLAADTSDPIVRATMHKASRTETGLPPGIVLKSTGTTTSTGTLSVSASTEVLALRLMDIDTSMFALPSGYTVINMGDELRTVRAKTDSLMRELEKINPGFGADLRRARDSLLGPIDSTKRRKP